MNSDKSRPRRHDLLKAFDDNCLVYIEFKSQNSGEILELLCSRPPSVRNQGVDSSRLVVDRMDEKRYEVIAWSSIKSWNRDGKVKTKVVDSLEA